MHIFVKTYLSPIQDTYTSKKSSHSKIDLYKKLFIIQKTYFKLTFAM